MSNSSSVISNRISDRPTPYIDRILQRPVIREDIVLDRLRRTLEARHDFANQSCQYPRVGIMDWKSGDIQLRQFNMTSLARIRGYVTKHNTYTNWRLKSAIQISATEDDLEQCLLNMDGVDGRVILLEQMPFEVVDVLGSIYEIDPQFWAQHHEPRHNSSWLWETSQQSKPFFSLRWCHPVSVDIKNPPWSHEWGPSTASEYMKYNDNSEELSQWFQSSLTLGLESEPTWQSPRRRLKGLFHSGTLITDAGCFGRAPAGLDQCTSIYFHQSDDAIPKTTIIILVDPSPLTRAQGQFEKRLLSARPSAPTSVPPQDIEDRWSLDDVWDSILHNHNSVAFPKFSPRLIVWSILEILQRDLIALASRSHFLIEEIRQSMRNPAMVQDNLRSRSWEHLLSNLAELEPVHRHTLETFSMALAILDPLEKPTLQFSQGPLVSLIDKTRLSPTSAFQMERLLHILTETSTEVAKTQAAFESRIALAERQHQLHEAKTMKRLTELAFVFIPLSLSTSIFGMELTEFKDGVPLLYWVITSLSLVFAAYAFRLFLTSRLWKGIRRLWIDTVVKLYPHYRGDEANIHKFAYITAIPYPIYKPLLDFVNFIDNIFTYPAGVPYLNPYTRTAIVIFYVASPLVAFPVIWTRESLSRDAKIAWTVFGIALSLNLWVWIPLGLMFWAGRHNDLKGALFLHILPALTLLSAAPLFTMAWTLPGLSIEARGGWTAAGAVMIVGGLGLLALRNAVRFRGRVR
ncbi:hypothetical protein QBC43DRAFT_300775 [Cladorrhinum sp. PSN259]|nr:hypothetical protein QBC43DRAFT_300775 [Cladorrhinum sp. PSN259]